MSRERIGSSGLRFWQKWYLVDPERPIQKVRGIIVDLDSPDPDIKVYSGDGDWNVWVRPDYEYQYLQYNSYNELQKRPPPKTTGIELEVRNNAADRLPLKDWLSGSKFVAEGWWVEDTAHLARDFSKQEAFTSEGRGKSELHPVHTFKSPDWTDQAFWVIVLSDESNRFSVGPVQRRLNVPFRQSVSTASLVQGRRWFRLDKISETARVDYVPSTGQIPDSWWDLAIQPFLTEVTTALSFDGLEIGIFQVSTVGGLDLGRMYAAAFERDNGRAYFSASAEKRTDAAGKQYVKWSVTTEDVSGVSHEEWSMRRPNGDVQSGPNFVINYGPAAGFPAEEWLLTLLGRTGGLDFEPGRRVTRRRGLGPPERRTFVSGRVALSPAPSAARLKVKATKFRVPDDMDTRSGPLEEVVAVLIEARTVAKAWRISHESYVHPLAVPTYVWSVRLNGGRWQAVDFSLPNGGVNLGNVVFKVMLSTLEIEMPDPPPETADLFEPLPALVTPQPLPSASANRAVVDVRLTLQTDIGEEDTAVVQFRNRAPKSMTDPDTMDLLVSLIMERFDWVWPPGVPVPGPGGPIYGEEMEDLLRRRAAVVLDSLPARFRGDLNKITRGEVADSTALSIWLGVVRQLSDSAIAAPPTTPGAPALRRRVLGPLYNEATGRLSSEASRSLNQIVTEIKMFPEKKFLFELRYHKAGDPGGNARVAGAQVRKLRRLLRAKGVTNAHVIVSHGKPIWRRKKLDQSLSVSIM